MTTSTVLKPSMRKLRPASNHKHATAKWCRPRVVEIAVGLEINSYACAGLI